MKKIVLQGLNETMYYDQCQNGLDVYMLPNKKVNNFYITFNVHFGSIHTEFKLPTQKNYTKVPTGIAHFLEHQMFYEPNGDIAHSVFANMGSIANAATTYKFTYYEVISATKFAENLNYILDFVQNPFFIKKNVESEKGIIIEEIKMDEDNPNAKLFNRLNENLYIKNTRRNPIPGTIEDVKKTTAEKIKLCYQSFYHPQNMFVIITGNFKPLEAMTIINENQNQKQFKKYKKPLLKNEKEPVSVALDYEELEMNVETPKVRIAYKIPYKNFKGIDDLKLRKYLGIILASKFDLSSDLREKLIESQIVTSGIDYQYFVDKDFIIISLSSDTKYPEELIRILEIEMNDLNINEDLLERKKRIGISNLIMTYDDIQSVNEGIQNQILVYGHILDNELDIYKSLNLKEAKRVINKITLNNRSILVIRPFGK